MSQRQRGFLMRWKSGGPLCTQPQGSSIRAGTVHTAEQKGSCTRVCKWSELFVKKKSPHRFTITIPVSKFPNTACVQNTRDGCTAIQSTTGTQKAQLQLTPLPHPKLHFGNEVSWKAETCHISCHTRLYQQRYLSNSILAFQNSSCFLN